MLYLRKSSLAILKIWDISQHQINPQWIFSAEIRIEIKTLSSIIGMFVKNNNVEGGNIE